MGSKEADSLSEEAASLAFVPIFALRPLFDFKLIKYHAVMHPLHSHLLASCASKLNQMQQHLLLPVYTTCKYFQPFILKYIQTCVIL